MKKRNPRIGRRRKGEAPQMRRHKTTNKAYVFYQGKRHPLGPWGSPAARRAYREWIGRWEAANRPKIEIPRGVSVTVGQLVDAHAEHAERHYRRRDGTITDEVRAFRRCTLELATQHVDRDVEELLGRDVRAIVDQWLTAGLARKTINKMLGRLKKVFRWGAKRELVSEATVARLALVEGLPIGTGRETPEVSPVPLRLLARTLRRLPADLAAMVRLQYYCGARPGEVCRMTGAEIVRGGKLRVDGRDVTIPEGVWAFVPSEHKTAKRGHFVYYLLGPKCQKLLSPILLKAGDGYLFPRPKSDCWNVTEYARRCARTSATIGYLAAAADPVAAAKTLRSADDKEKSRLLAPFESWSPGQLRHNFLTRWDSIASMELASAAVRHKHLSTTAVYVQRDLSRVGPIARKHG